jgi:heme exporter protein D
MTPDLGKYADTVLSAYGASVVLLIVLIGLSVYRGRKIRAALARIEARLGHKNG